MTFIAMLGENLAKISQSRNEWKHNPWVLGWLTLLSVVLAVNIALIVMAVITNPGLVAKNYYEQGRAHEQNVLRKIAARNALQWDIHTDLTDRLIVNTKFAYGTQIRDKQGLPITHANVQLLAYRPSDAQADFTIPLIEIKEGHYRGELTLPLKGVWDLIIQIQHGADNYDATERVHVLEQ